MALIEKLLIFNIVHAKTVYFKLDEIYVSIGFDE